MALRLRYSRKVRAEPVLVDELERDEGRPAAYDGTCSRRRHGSRRPSAARGPTARLRRLLGPLGPLRHADAHGSSALNLSVRADRRRSCSRVRSAANGIARLRLDELLPTKCTRAPAGTGASGAEVLRSVCAQTCCAVACQVVDRYRRPVQTSVKRQIGDEPSVQRFVQTRVKRCARRADIACRPCVQTRGPARRGTSPARAVGSDASLSTRPCPAPPCPARPVTAQATPTANEPRRVRHRRCIGVKRTTRGFAIARARSR